MMTLERFHHGKLSFDGGLGQVAANLLTTPNMHHNPYHSTSCSAVCVRLSVYVRMCMCMCVCTCASACGACLCGRLRVLMDPPSLDVPITKDGLQSTE